MYRNICFQINVFLNRLNGQPIGVSVLGIFVIDKNTILAVRWLFALKGKGSPYSITERRVPELIPVLGSQPAGDVSHKPGHYFRQACSYPATLKRAATNFAA